MSEHLPLPRGRRPNWHWLPPQPPRRTALSIGLIAPWYVSPHAICEEVTMHDQGERIVSGLLWARLDISNSKSIDNCTCLASNASVG